MVSPVWFYVPNLIGYSRILFAILAFYFSYTNYVYFFIFYAISAWLDIADGHAARALNQCSRFGAILDMVTDRASTSCLIVVLANFFPEWSFFYLSMIALDIMSHFAHIISSLSRGNTSHKAVTKEQSWFLRLYYTNRLVLGFLCFGNEGFFLHLYLLHFWPGPSIPLGPLAALAPIIGCEGGVIPLVKALVLFFYMPIMAVKQFMNLVQLKQACEDIVALDDKERLLNSQKNK